MPRTVPEPPASHRRWTAGWLMAVVALSNLDQGALARICLAWFDGPVQIRDLYGDSDRNALKIRPDGQRTILKICSGNDAAARRRVGILPSVDGPLHNAIKFKPPMVFDRDNAEELCTALDDELTRL